MKYINIPKPKSDHEISEISLQNLRPTQICLGLAEVWHRKREFKRKDPTNISIYLKRKPVPLVKNKDGESWILDRHHRLRALLELNQECKAYGYTVAEVNSTKYSEVVKFLMERNWLYLYNERGLGPNPIQALPHSLLDIRDDPYRSLVWKLKEEGLINSNSLIPFYEFRWSAFLRTRPLPPFNSKNLEPCLPAARSLVNLLTVSSLLKQSKSIN